MGWKAYNIAKAELEDALQHALNHGPPGHIIGFAYNPNNEKWHVGYWSETED